MNNGLEKERKEVLPIIAALVAAIAPHAPGLPPWITLWCFSMWGYMVARLKTGWPLPPAPVRYGLTFLGILGLLATYPRGIGADAFVGLMALMAAIKPFEMPSHRHQMITILLTYFMIITSLFRSDALFIVIYMVFSVFVTTTAMININTPDATFRQSQKLAATILAQALPLVAVLFLVFPRLPGALVGFQDPARGNTGFAEAMAPGKISSMALDPTPAFRVTFDRGSPPPVPLYWRGIVFQDFDGNTWRPDSPPKPSTQPAPKGTYVPGETDIGYTVLLAPHNSRWLMALDRPVKGPPWAVLEKDFTLKSRKKIRKKTQYKAVSRIQPSLTAPSDTRPPGELTRRILNSGNPKTLALAKRITGQGTPREKADRLLAYFKNNSFVYTLNAPLSGPHPLDTFIFQSKKGYCEHYASAVAFMLNGAGVPARVVGGYLGGEFNPIGEYFIVRQAYAHAWVEFHDQQKGWTRLDPTSVVSPDRILTNPDGSSSTAVAGRGSLSLFTRLGFALDAVNLKWEFWFTGYSLVEQKAWLAALGLVRQNKSAGLTLAILTLLVICLFLWGVARQFKRNKRRDDPVILAMEKFFKKLKRLELTPAPGQGPMAFLYQCMEKRPDLANDIHSILDLYLGLRYKRPSPDTSLAELQNRVNRFTPLEHKENT